MCKRLQSSYFTIVTFGVCIIVIQSVDKKVKKVTSKGIISHVRKEDFSKVIVTQILSNPRKKKWMKILQCDYFIIVHDFY